MKKVNIQVDISAQDLKDKMGLKNGENYNLTTSDKQEIADMIDVPVVEKVVEKTEVIKEVPNEVTGEEIVNKINDLPLDEDKKIDAKHIKNLPENRGQIFGGKQNLYQLNDVSKSIAQATNGQVLKKNTTTGLWEAGNDTGSTSFITLTDTPNSYSGQSGKYPVVNATEDGLEFGTITSSSNLTYMFANIASDVSTYYQAVPLSSYVVGTIGDTSASCSTTPTIIGKFVTNAGFPNVTVIPAGTITIHIDTEKVAGSNNYYIFANIYKRNLAGTETLLATSDNSTQTAANTQINQTVTALLATNTTLLATDRLVVKIYGVMVSSTATIHCYFDDSTSARIEFPTTFVDPTNYVPYTGATKDVELGTNNLIANAIAAGSTPFTPIVPVQGKQSNTYTVSQADPTLSTSFTVVPDLAAANTTGSATSIGNISTPSGNELVGSGNLVANGQTINFQFVSYKVINGVRYYSPVQNVAVNENINDGTSSWYESFSWSAVGTPDGYAVYDDYSGQTWDLGNNTSADYQSSAVWSVGSNTGENINTNIGWVSVGGSVSFDSYSYGFDPTDGVTPYYTPTNTPLSITEPASGEAYIIRFDPGTLVTGASGVKIIEVATNFGIILSTATDTSVSYFLSHGAGPTVTPTSYGILSTGQTHTYSVYPLVQIVKTASEYYPIYGSQSNTTNAVFPNDSQYRTVTLDWHTGSTNFTADGTALYGYKIKRTISAADTYLISPTSSSFATAVLTDTFTNNTAFPDSSAVTPTSFIPDTSILENDAPNADPTSSSSTAKPQLTLKSTVSSGMAGLRLVDGTDVTKLWLYDYGTNGYLRVADGQQLVFGNYSNDWLAFSSAGILTLTSPFTVKTTSVNQLKILYDLSHQFTASVNSAGLTTLTSTGGFSFASGITMGSGINFTFNTSTGTKFGTATNQKLAFYGVTPIIQPTATTDLGTVLSNLGLRASGTAYPITTSGNITLSGTTMSFSKFTTYNGLTLAGNGLTVTTGVADLVAQSAAKTATTLYTPTTFGMFRISITLQVTRAASASSVLGGATGVVITFTEPDGSVAQTVVPLLVDQAGAVINPATGNTGNTTGTSSHGEVVIYAKASTAIQYAIGYTSVGSTSMQYSAHLRLQAL